MKKRKMVQANLVKNSIAAYYAAIEIHNKPKMPYRYETVTLLIMNAWELILKAYIRKYIKNRSIYTNNGHTIGLDKALDYVAENINGKKKNSFSAIKENILLVEDYRNQITHFYCDELEPYIFMLVARCALNYVDFVKRYFNKDVMEDDGLFIMPLGFKLPFLPEDFLSNNVAKYASSSEAQQFINDIVKVTRELNAGGIDDSVVLGFDIYLESVKKATNSDILAAITSKEDAEITIAKVTKYEASRDANTTLQLSDEEFRNVWKYSHTDVVEWCKANIDGFKRDKVFNAAKKAISEDIKCVYERRLDSKNSKSASQKFYSDEALERLKQYYELNRKHDD